MKNRLTCYLTARKIAGCAREGRKGASSASSGNLPGGACGLAARLSGAGPLTAPHSIHRQRGRRRRRRDEQIAYYSALRRSNVVSPPGFRYLRRMCHELRGVRVNVGPFLAGSAAARRRRTQGAVYCSSRVPSRRRLKDSAPSGLDRIIVGEQSLHQRGRCRLPCSCSSGGSSGCSSGGSSGGSSQVRSELESSSRSRCYCLRRG